MKNKNFNKEKCPHIGHRQRMLEKIEKLGLKSLDAHEVLEYLLWFTIPRKDTNPHGHKLLNTFGSIANVLDADPNYLASIEGVGKRTALFLTSLPEVFDIYKESIGTGKLDILNNVSACVKYFRSRFEIRKQEVFYIFCLNGKNKVVKYETLKGVSDVQIEVDTKHFAEFINDENTASVLICHTHPLGEVKPSNEDLATTEELMRVCNIMHKNLLDHIIFNHTEHFSMGANKILDCMRLSVSYEMEPMMDASLRSRSFTKFSYLDSEDELGVKIGTWKKRFQDLAKLKELQNRCANLEAENNKGIQ